MGWDKIEGGHAYGLGYNKVCMGWDRIGGVHA